MSEELDPDAIERFLGELTELTRRHGIEIGGCGCCGSPFLSAVKKPGRYVYNPKPGGGSEVNWKKDNP